MLAEDLEYTGTDRFAIQRRIGHGAMGVVFQAWDREREQVVALKTLRNLTPQSLYRLKNEFRGLADLQHPNLVRLGDLLYDEKCCRWFITMELIEGATFTRFVRGAEPTDHEGEELPGFDEDRLRDALGQLVRAVHALERAGKVHRDIKPSNILVTPEGRVVLLDFGLLADAERDHHVADGGKLVGTPDYMAPEQADGTRPVGPEADWYAVGVVLYEALTGCLPYSGSTRQVIANKQAFPPIQPRALQPGVPADLDVLCMELLALDPAARPGGADVLRRLGVRALDARIESQQPFVGRARELTLLREAFGDARRGQTVTVLVRGESGVGKTTLVERFLRELDAEPWGATVLRGRCYERERVPFKALDGVVDALSRHLVQLSDFDAALLLCDDPTPLARLFPVLRRVPTLAQASDPREEIPPAELRRRGFRALGKLLWRLAKRGPVCLFIDDLHWGDPDSLLLVSDLLTTAENPPPILFLGTVRSDGLTDLSPFPADLRHVMLENLQPEECRALVRVLAPGKPPEEVAAIAEASGGHPLFAGELVRNVQPPPKTRKPQGSRLDQVLWARLRGQDEPVRRLVELISIAGAPTSVGQVAEALALPRADLLEALGAAVRGHFVHATGVGPEDRVEPWHDQVRQAVLANLPAPVADQLAQQLADARQNSRS